MYVHRILTLTPRSDSAPLPVVLTGRNALADDLVSSLAAVLDECADAVAVSDAGSDGCSNERPTVVAVVARH